MPSDFQRQRQPPVVPRYLSDPRDKWNIGGAVYVPVSSDDTGHVLRHLDSGLSESFTHEVIEELRQADKLRVEPGFYAEEKARLRNIYEVFSIGQMPADKQTRVFHRKHMVDGFLRLESESGIRRSDKAMKSVIPGLHSVFCQQEIARQTADGRCGNTVSLPLPPSPTTLRRWLKRYEEGGYEDVSMADRYHRSGNRIPRLSAEQFEILDEFVSQYASRLKPKRTSTYEDMCDEIKRRNREKTVAEKPLIGTVSFATFNRAIDNMDPYRKLVGREGPEAAKRKMFIVNGGLDVTFPLQRIEMDEFNIPLHTFLEKAEIWSRLSKEERNEIKRARQWLSTAIDTRTRCCLAAVMVDSTGSTSTAVATLRMAVGDRKRIIAEEAGCETPWDMFGIPDCVVTDNGSGYESHHFRAVVADLHSQALRTPAAMPQMRGRQERFYRTLHDRLLSRLSGRTFENIREKGDYKSEENAVLDPDELGRLIVRFIVDVYHNTPHAGLHGSTPRQEWLRLTRHAPVRMPPDREVTRHIFGTPVEKFIGSEGILFLGLRYQSRELQMLRRNVRGRKVPIRVDQDDLSEISVAVDDSGWISVKCLRPNMGGVSADLWIARVRALRRRNAIEAGASADTVERAMAEIEAYGQVAIERAGIASPILTDQGFDLAEKGLFAGLEFACRPYGEHDASDLNFEAQETVDEKPDATDPEQPASDHPEAEDGPIEDRDDSIFFEE